MPAAAGPLARGATQAPKRPAISASAPSPLQASIPSRTINGNIANAAIYLLEPELFSVLDRFESPPVEFSTDVLPRVLDRLHTFHNDVYHRDIGTLASLAQAQLDYFCAAGAAPTQTGDPWYGMMTENGGRLARNFARAVEAAFPVR